MYCPKCGKENPDDAQVCSSCISPLTEVPASSAETIVKTSGLAIAAFVLGILSPFTCAITVIPAIILGIISLVQIEKSGGRLAGRAFAIIGIVVPVSICLLIGILLPALVKARQTAHRMFCGANLSQIGMAMLVYANDYEDKLPCAGGPTSKWGYTSNWQAIDRFSAFNLSPDGSGGAASISANFYLLVKYTDVTPKLFLCYGDRKTKKFVPAKYNVRDKELIDLWDFGPEPWKHCSYTYHIPYGLYPLTTLSEPGMAVAADRNPWIISPAADAKDFSRFKPDIPPWNGKVKQAKYGNAITHQDDGQNVLFMDSHVDFEKRAWCGVEDDNIYTHLPQGLGHPQQGLQPIPFVSQPGHRKDSLLLHDPAPLVPARPPPRRR